MKQKNVNLFSDIAKRVALQSYAKRLQVGAIVVKDERIISIGYNGMPSGWDNNCEDKVYDKGAGGWLDPEEFDQLYPYEDEVEVVDPDEYVFTTKIRYGLKTKPEVLHAESNAIAKLAKSNESGEGASLFVTHSPCLECAKLIYQAGITRVYYGQAYRDDSGLEFLRKSNIEIINTGE